MPLMKLQRIVYASLFAALTAMGAYIHIPFGPVPIVLQNLFVLLAGLLLGARWGAVSMGIYLLVGAAGIPVFAGAKGGLAHFMGPTGGYLFGFVAAAFLTGWISTHKVGRAWVDGIAVVTGCFTIYAFGVPWLKVVTGMTWTKAFMAGMAPFLIGDLLKAACALAIARSTRPAVTRSLEAFSS